MVQRQGPITQGHLPGLWGGTDRVVLPTRYLEEDTIRSFTEIKVRSIFPFSIVHVSVIQ